jgi:transcriptional regulator with AAA-type ATPase domain
MAGTLSGKTSRDAPRLSPTLVHVASYDDLLAEPQGLFPVGPELIVGRAPGPSSVTNGLWLADQRVSTKHLSLRLGASGVVATDLGSSNGTSLNGAPLTAPAVLNDGDLLEVGRSLLCFRVYPKVPPREGWAWGAERTFNPELGKLGGQLDRIAASDEPVLLLGETGAGKEIAARRVHQVSKRPGPLVAVDCGAMPEQLFESTLFGHEKGAFTGATEARQGEIARAHHGTLFLDEVGNLPPAMQSKLLRVLETKTVKPVGGREAVKVDVRWVAATNATLSDDEFRSDLRFRLAGFVAKLPPLRRRREDLGLLIASMLREAGVRKATVTRAAASRLFAHEFPGNVRQLRQVLRTAVTLHRDDDVLELDVDAFEALAGPEAEPSLRKAQRLPAVVIERGGMPERAELERALTEAQGIVAAAARALGTSSRQLYRWLERLDIDPDAFRE